MSRRVLFLSALTAVALGGCATIPQPLAGNYAPVTLEAARSGTAGAAQVRWGGEIVETQPREQQTCFYVLAEPLDSQARPKRGEESMGRFVACKQGFYDPEVFAKGREITVTGSLSGTVQHKIGEFDYTYPRIEAANVYLWPKRPMYMERPYPYGYGPWGPWGPWGDPFWGGWGPWGYGPWYSPPRVIVVPRRPPPPPPPKKG